MLFFLQEGPETFSTSLLAFAPLLENGFQSEKYVKRKQLVHTFILFRYLPCVVYSVWLEMFDSAEFRGTAMLRLGEGTSLGEEADLTEGLRKG